MTKLRIICSKKDTKKIISLLYKEKAIDIIQHQSNEDIDIGNPIYGNEDISEAIVKARSIRYRFKSNKEQKKAIGYSIEECIDTINKAHERIEAEFNEIQIIDEKLKNLMDDWEKVKILDKLKIDLDLFKESKLVSFFVGSVRDKRLFRKEIIREFPGRSEITTKTINDKDMFVLFVDKKLSNDANNIMKKYGFVEMKLPSLEVLNNKSMKILKKEIFDLTINKKDAKKRIELLKKRYESKIITIENILSEYSTKFEAPLMFGETKNISIISGWIPKSKAGMVLGKVNKLTAENVYIEKLKIKENDNVPIKLQNPELVKPYEFLLRMFSMPSYEELDPTLFMFITFPIFFGFMLGDIGYGIVTLLLFGLLKRKLPKMAGVFNIMIFSSIASILFGIIYGEFFGFELSEFHIFESLIHHYNLHYPLIHRNAHNAMQLIMISMGIGAIHVNFGLILGFINKYKSSGLTHAIYEKGSWFILELAVVILAMGMIQNVLMDKLIGGFFILFAAVMLYKGEGVQGLVELPSIFVHIGSYVRLMAIGLASVGLAVVVNQQTELLFHSGPIYMAMGILVFIVGHIINIALGVIGPFLHSLRLHYVEYFTKFYKGGGKEFKPFGAKKFSE